MSREARCPSAARALADRLGRLALIGIAAGSLIGVPTAYSLLDAREPGRSSQNAATTTEAPAVEDSPIIDEDDNNPHAPVMRSGDGLFYVRTRMNGVPIRCVVDTGASAIVLSARQGARIGMRAGPIHYADRILTPAGSYPAARTRLETVEIAGRNFRDVKAILAPGSVTPCLIGQDLLARLPKMEFQGDELYLH